MSKKLGNSKNLYLEGIGQDRAREAVCKYTGAQYIQHSTGVKDGVEDFVEFFEPFIARNPKRDIQIIRTIEDWKYIFLHVYQSLNSGEAQWDTTDFFDTDDKDAVVYGLLRHKLKVNGQMIGLNEMLLASQAFCKNLILVSNNLREFNRIKKLKTEDWTKPFYNNLL